jgi:predicted phosphoribosyltransferase
MQFIDRKDAGRKLATYLYTKYHQDDVLVFALPRGGVVTGYEVASIFRVPLNVIITRKIGHPLEPEYAIAVMSENGNLVHDTPEIDRVNHVWLAREICKEQREIRRRKELYGVTHEIPVVTGKTVLLIDDGIATGLTMRAALSEIQRYHPRRVIVGVPVMPPSVKKQLEAEGIIVESLCTEQHFSAVGSYYLRFYPTSDEEVIQLLQKARSCDADHGKNMSSVI